MIAPSLRFGIVLAAAASAAGCASPRGGTALQDFVLAHAEPAQLAEALTKQLARLPADDPRRADPKVAALRGLLEGAPAVMMAAAPPIETAVQPVALLARLEAGGAIPLATAADIPQPLTLAFNDPPAPLAPVIAKPPAAFAVVLGTFDDAALAASVWRELAAADPLAVNGLSPRLSTKKGQPGVTMVAGPLEDSEVAAGRCTAFTALGVQCTPGAYAGKPLPSRSGA
jgi:hypothetical protein